MVDKLDAKLGILSKEDERILRRVGWNNSPGLTFEEFHKLLVEADV